MSGGIDSSVAAWILKRDAHEVVGVTLRFHGSPQRDAAIERAQSCAAMLGIEHHVIDLRDEFARMVKDYTTREFEEGRFPNPCTVCTRDLKMPRSSSRHRPLAASRSLPVIMPVSPRT